MWCSGVGTRYGTLRATGARASRPHSDDFRRSVRGDRGIKAGTGSQQQKYDSLNERRGVEASAVSTSAAEAVHADDDGLQRSGYPFKEIEGKWQRYWEENRTFSTARIDAGSGSAPRLDTSRPKFYALDMFPYPSGAGLHVGHPEGYTATDIISRFKRMKGYNVLHPMGWDAFGLPAEQYALQTGTHPEVTTRKNITRFKSQLKVRPKGK